MAVTNRRNNDHQNEREDHNRNVHQPWVRPLGERPLDIAEAETARLVQKGVPVRSKPHRWTREDVEQISTVLLQYPRRMPNVTPIVIPDPINGRPLYLLSQRRSNQYGGFILTVADLAEDGSGYVFRFDAGLSEDPQEQWKVTTYYLNYEEISCLQAAADDARGVGHRPEGA